MAMHHYTEGRCRSRDGTEIFYSVSGPGRETGEPDFVLCDGLGCDGFVWKYLVPTLADHHRVVRYHYRGHGRSKLPSDMSRFAIIDLVDDMEAVLDALGIHENLIIAGHSMGVQVLLEAHRRFSERVAALVPTCGSYGNPLDTFHDADILKRSFPFLYHVFTGFPEAVMRLWSALLPSKLAYFTALVAGEVNRSLIRLEDLQPYFDHLARMNAEVFARTLYHASIHSARDHLPRIDVPVLVIGAENDTFTPSWLSHEIADQIPGSELLMIPKGSHAAPLEQPDLIALRLEKFLVERLGCYAEERRRAASVEPSSETSERGNRARPAKTAKTVKTAKAAKTRRQPRKKQAAKPAAKKGAAAGS
ncbi:MAG: alpha/beta fold hydrolase [Myxococcota bacterium]